MVDEMIEDEELRQTVGAMNARGLLDQVRLSVSRAELPKGHHRSDTLQLAYEIAPDIAPLIGRDKE